MLADDCWVDGGEVVCSIEANQMEDRAMNKMWLVRHLEVTRQLVLEDLRVVKVMIHRLFNSGLQLLNS